MAPRQGAKSFQVISIFELENRLQVAGKWRMSSVCQHYLILEMKALGGSITRERIASAEQAKEE